MAELLAASRAVITILLSPACNGILDAVQFGKTTIEPVAPFELLAQVIVVTYILSATVPPTSIVALAVVKVGGSGEVITKVGGNVSLKFAVTALTASTVTVQVPVPEQPLPDQPVNVDPAAAAAVKVTEVPLVNGALQVGPQLMPAGFDVTVPAPLPVLVIDKPKLNNEKSAVTVWSLFIVIVQGLMPLQPPPDQPVKTELGLGVKDRVTTAPSLKVALAVLQVGSQLIVPGVEKIVPVPTPLLPMVNVRNTTKLAATF